MAEKKKSEKEIKKADNLAKKTLDKKVKKIQVVAKATKMMKKKMEKNIKNMVEKKQTLKYKIILTSTSVSFKKKKKKEFPLVKKLDTANN